MYINYYVYIYLSIDSITVYNYVILEINYLLTYLLKQYFQINIDHDSYLQCIADLFIEDNNFQNNRNSPCDMWSVFFAWQCCDIQDEHTHDNSKESKACPGQPVVGQNF